MRKRKKKKKELEKLISYSFYSKFSNSKVGEISILERALLKQNLQKNKVNSVTAFTKWIFESTKGKRITKNIGLGLQVRGKFMHHSHSCTDVARAGRIGPK